MAPIVAGLFDVHCGFVLHPVKHTAVDLRKPTVDFEVTSNLRDALLLGTQPEPFSPSDRTGLAALFDLPELKCLSVLDAVSVGSGAGGKQKSDDHGGDLAHDILLSCGKSAVHASLSMNGY
jgi:hypothetical protein